MSETQSGRPISGILTNILRGIIPIAVEWSGMIGYAFLDDGGVFTDDTTDANSAAANDVPLMPAVPVLNDAFYFGEGFNPSGVFNYLRINIGTAGVGGTIAWEYYTTGAAWAALAVTDGTNGFTTTGVSYMNWIAPADMNHVAVNGQDRYWVRARVLTAFAPIPMATQIWLGKIPAVLANASDGNMSTATETGRLVASGASTYGYLTFDLGSIKTVLASCRLGLWSSASSLSASWYSSNDNITYRSALTATSGVTSSSELISEGYGVILIGRYIRLRWNAGGAATINTKIYEVVAYELSN